MDEYIIKVTGKVTKDQLDKLLNELGKNGWIATDKNVTTMVIKDSIREEIKDRVKEEYSWNTEMLSKDDKEEFSDEAAKDILEMFEKRIDSIFDTFIENNPNLQIKDDQHKYCVQNERRDLYHIKGELKEMLK